MEVCYLGIGSNLGNRRKNIEEAVSRIGRLEGTRVIKRSPLISTKPVGGPAGQPRFLNAALKIKTRLPALRLLRELKAIEKSLGRTKSVRNGPRAIDLDILFYGDRVIRYKDLAVPHPRLFSRDFVIRPLSRIL